MNTYDSLIRAFERFPGIGARQAKRFVYHLLREDTAELEKLSTEIKNLKNEVRTCPSCMRFFVGYGDTHCSICTNGSREENKLMVVESDADIEPIERSGIYTGRYFVLGGTVPLLNTKEHFPLNSGALRALLTERSDLEEVILAFAVNPDGENTARFVEKLITDTLGENNNLKVSVLGRGLSTGSELEYADPETIKNALRNRSTTQ